MTKPDTDSRQVAWFETFRYAGSFAAEHGIDLLNEGLPIPGTPRWCGLPDSDARKLLALLFGGVREALANDARQAALAEASADISTIATATHLGPRRRPRGPAYISRRTA
jgi:hypothetical protein